MRCSKAKGQFSPITELEDRGNNQVGQSEEMYSRYLNICSCHFQDNSRAFYLFYFFFKRLNTKTAAWNRVVSFKQKGRKKQRSFRLPPQGQHPLQSMSHKQPWKSQLHGGFWLLSIIFPQGLESWCQRTAQQGFVGVKSGPGCPGPWAVDVVQEGEKMLLAVVF